MLHKTEKSEIFIKMSFVTLSILGMSSLLYEKLRVLYQFATIAMVGITIVVFLMNYKKKIYDKRLIFLIFLMLVTHSLSAIVNYRSNFIGNMIEVAFMFAYLLIMVVYSKNTQEKIIEYTFYTVQFFSFASFLFTLVIIILRKKFIFFIDTQEYIYGFHNGRIWGFLNPNPSAIFTYISIFTALFIISKYRKKRHLLLKINILLQFIHLSIQQSRGAILSVTVAIFIYSLCITREKNLARRFVKFMAYFGLVLAGFFLIEQSLTLYSNHIEQSNVISDEDNKKFHDRNVRMRQSEKHAIEGRLTNTSSTGRTEIWSTGWRMYKEHPIFGYTPRSISKSYKKYFDKYLMENSIHGGSFHNIFMTTLLYGGAISLLVFLSLLGYIGYHFIKYLLNGKDINIKLLILLFFAILTGQLFESTILYSTNFINIFFWLICGYTMNKIRTEKAERHEITDREELKKIKIDILDYIVGVCDKLNLKYWLGYGTLIGAVRHKGFIPWNDDIKICLFRDDYEKLQNYLLKNSNPTYRLMSYKNNENYVHPFMKVVHSETYLVERDIFKDPDLGIYVDIFPVDGYDDNTNIRNKLTKLNKKRQLSCYTFYGIYDERSILSTIMRNVGILLYSFTDTRKYIRKIDYLARSESIEDCRYVDCVVCNDIKTPVMKKEWFYNTIDWPFCGKMYKIPEKYDEILRADYGDYMQMPPINERVNNQNFRVWRR